MAEGAGGRTLLFPEHPHFNCFIIPIETLRYSSLLQFAFIKILINPYMLSVNHIFHVMGDSRIQESLPSKSYRLGHSWDAMDIAEGVSPEN